MAFSNFKNIQQVIQKYPLRIKRAGFLPDTPIELPEWFLDNLNFSVNRQPAHTSEAFFSVRNLQGFGNLEGLALNIIMTRIVYNKVTTRIVYNKGL